MTQIELEKLRVAATRLSRLLGQTQVMALSFLEGEPADMRRSEIVRMVREGLAELTTIHRLLGES